MMPKGQLGRCRPGREQQGGGRPACCDGRSVTLFYLKKIGRHFYKVIINKSKHDVHRRAEAISAKARIVNQAVILHTICLTKRKKSATAVIGEDNMQFFVMISYPTENGNLTDE
ncbi:hypothetical protein T07_1284 [Trichinella nelsoni]|uniref:Uncharacterized protein n=1 Tax=Trichinella nelsoni TaxID=6336 RepID=A0A0V0SG02_9BILA|nr:hypothetical protein T07_1284 [Trichinella nelsoni]